MGFDQFFSIENWGEEMDRLRNYCSDQSLYNRIVDLYNSKEKDQKNFIFCVTMQNHGGYTEERSAGYEPDVKLDYDGEYPLAEMYLSLARQSDEAFKNLIVYFEKVDEPTMIVMFGDHWPKLEDGFYSKVYQGKAESGFYSIYLSGIGRNPCTDLRLYRLSGTGYADCNAPCRIHAWTKRSCAPSNVQKKG